MKGEPVGNDIMKIGVCQWIFFMVMLFNHISIDIFIEVYLVFLKNKFAVVYLP